MRTIQLIDGKAVFVDIPEPEPDAPEPKPAEPVTKAKRQPKKK